MIGQSQSGTGKTAAFALTMLKRVDPSVPEFRPFVWLPRVNLPVKFGCRPGHGTIPQMSLHPWLVVKLKASQRSAAGPITSSILIGTPGTILDLERRRQLDLSAVKLYVLDEADVMLDRQGLGVQSLRIKAMPRQCPNSSVFSHFHSTSR